jgi:hypothetical protein
MTKNQKSDAAFLTRLYSQPIQRSSVTLSGDLMTIIGDAVHMVSADVSRGIKSICLN